ncbi:hypothetical protein P168DRAFT_280109 [Aspergillus campestris IBT 28561]|uniref:Autophagy-related protein 2 n=1 Tax=Aspergillus campestris (strain IBT 28561) TaxID=1392248 RepID=A0A2I1DA18_ASPC2|nr:uncharacterized protein P168DRAFT_280109 [Aspergillus campestris IBT 28561]PKY06725.1 hypothetical protein P168DRAFT_280109 [Aspergillus campestris IBT 28561]
MAYFLPAYFQKQAIRYVLSRLELFDAETLDLERLGLCWGQRSSVELRDVGLRLEKLATLLHLPPSSKLLSARVRFLKLTVPADIRSSGIVCQASGIDIHLRLLPEEECHAGKDGQGTSRRGPGPDNILPNPADLAESFLEAEPKEEKEEVQAAIYSQSQILQRTTSSLSDDDEDELGLGNEGVSLPTFVADFLQGVADRLQIQVDDISVRIDMETKQEGMSKRQPEDKPDLIAALLTVRQVCVEGVSVSDEVPSKKGKRLVSLSDINIALISEPVVFSNYSRFNAPPESPSTPTQSRPSQPPSRYPSPPPVDSSSSSVALAMTKSTIFENPGAVVGPVSRPGDAPEMEASTYTYDGRFSDADTEEDHPPYGYLEDSQTLSDDERLLDNPDYLDSVIDTQLHDEDIEGSTDLLLQDEQQLLRSGDTPRPRSPGPQFSESIPYRDQAGAPIPTPHLLDTGSDGLSSSSRRDQHDLEMRSSFPRAPLLDMYPDEPPYRDNADLRTSHITSPPSEASSSDSAQENYRDAELSESRLFSHEQAQSMYMSAISQASTAKSFMPNIPGAWDTPETTIARDTVASGRSGATGDGAHDRDSANDQDDETMISTPKLGAQSEPRLSQSQLSDHSDAAGSDPTDRGSARSAPTLEKSDVAKRLFHVDHISVWIPSRDGDDSEPDEKETPYAHPRTRADSLRDSTIHMQDSTVEGDLLSSRSHAIARPRNDSTASSVLPGSPLHHGGNERERKMDESQVAVEVGSVGIQFDIATGWLVAKVGQRLLATFNPGDAPSKKPPAEQTSSKQAFRLVLNQLSIKFVEHVPGQACPSHESGLQSPVFFGLLHEDVLLQAKASGLEADFLSTADTTKFRLDVSKFSLGFASEDLISFNEDLKMRESTRDVLSPMHGDISLSLTKSSEAARVNFTTLPLHLNVNIQRLEELIGWFGGLSTILELGSSISSVSAAKPPRSEPNKPRRGVHFESTPPPAVRSESRSVPWKMNSRIGGVAVDIVGETHYLKLRTSAVKTVSRYEGIGVQIDKVKVSGPIPLGGFKDAPAKINMGNVRVEFLYAPKEADLDRLLSLITPSQDKYDEDDDIMVDTLLKQRRQGSVLRPTVAEAKLVINRTSELEALVQLGEELGRLSNVAKYLPEDDRPGILILPLIRDFEARVQVGGKVGNIAISMKNAEAAHISIPSLIAAQVGSINFIRNGHEELLGEALPSSPMHDPTATEHPMLMARFIADEMEPTIKIKLHRLRAEYTIPSIMAVLGLGDDVTTGDVAVNMANSLANVAEIQHPQRRSSSPMSPGSPKDHQKPIKLAMTLRDCVLGLNPRGTPAKGLLVLTSAKFSGSIHDSVASEAVLDLRKASIMVIDDIQNIETTGNVRQGNWSDQGNAVQSFMDQGFVPVSTISSATATVRIMQLSDDGTKSLDVELKDDLLILETCADSTQTLISIVNGLQPPTPPSTETKYRTEVLPLQDMLASFSGDAFTMDQSPDHETSQPVAGSDEDSPKRDTIDDELEYVSDFYPVTHGPGHESIPEGMVGSGTNDLLDSFHSQYYVSSSISDLEFQDDHFAKKSAVGGTAHRWDSTRNTYGLSDDSKLQKSPLRIRVRDAHVIWNLFDGYDWQRTRDTISKAVKDVERKATERRARSGSRASPGFEEEEESVIGDCLFNSIYIGIPANKDPRELRSDINRNIDDLVSETGSYATTTTVTGATARQSQPPLSRKKLRLSRSKYHKMTFELKGICADLVVFPPNSGETQSSLDVRVKDLVIFDHVPTSTWKKFATYMQEAGEKESGTSMVHIELLTVRPVPELAASEIVLKATLLPLRLHVDQDALDFICRFFEFRDESAPEPSAPGDIPFLQRVEVNSIPVKLDFKPKRVDYAGLRSGRTTEFMNFFVLDGADMVMRHVIIYGVSGFDKMGQTLNDIWMPDIKRNQLPGVLAGLAPIRSLVNVGGGMKDLVVVPMREYRKDGRIVRSIQKGALSFAKTTSNELVKLGAKLAIGTQTVLQGAEDLLTTPAPVVNLEEGQLDEEEAKKISPYADQPIGVVQGLRGAFRGLERDLVLARDAIVAVPGEVVESGSASAAAKAVWKRTPTVILRPAIGVSKAVGKTLLGAGNTLDPSNRQKMEDKYKRH